MSTPSPFVLPAVDAARQRAGHAMLRADRDLDDAYAQIERLRAETGWTSRGLRSLQESLAELHGATLQNRQSLQWVLGRA